MPRSSKDTSLVSIAEAAKRLGVTTDRIKSWLEEGLLAGERVVSDAKRKRLIELGLESGFEEHADRWRIERDAVVEFRRQYPKLVCAKGKSPLNKQIELPIERKAESGQVGLLVERYRTLCREYRRSDLIENFERQRIFRKEVLYEIRECGEKLNELADTNNPEICFAIGLSHSMHIERDYDPASAIKWFQKAADLGHLEAMVLLGGHFTRNDKFEDREKAAYWFRRAADAGNPSGMTRLGFAYREGSGVPQDFQKAVHWFGKASERGELQCLVTAGQVYWHNLNQPEKALELFLRASKCGRRDSYLDLAMFYGDRGTSLYSPEESIKWYWETLGSSGKYSSPRSLFALATYYRNGEGTGQNIRKARALLEELVELRLEGNPFYQQAEEMLRDIEDSNS